MSQWVKNPSEMQEMQETGVLSLSWEDPLDFYGGIQHFIVNGCSAASCYLEFSHEKMSTRPSTPPLVSISSFLQVILHRTFAEHKHPEGKDILLFFNISLLPFQQNWLQETGVSFCPGTKNYLKLNWPHTAHNSSREIPKIFLLLSFKFFKF